VTPFNPNVSKIPMKRNQNGDPNVQNSQRGYLHGNDHGQPPPSRSSKRRTLKPKDIQ